MDKLQIKIPVNLDLSEFGDLKKIVEKLNKDTKLDIGFNTTNVNKQIDGVQKKIEKVFKKAKFGGEGFDDLQKRIRLINESATIQAKVTTQTYRNTKNIKQAVIEYTNEQGKAVRETMAWTSHLDKANNKVKKVFQTTGFTFVDDVKKMENLQNKIEKFQKDMAISSSNLKGRYGDLYNKDSLSNLENKIKNISSSTPNAVHQMNMMKTELRSIESNARNSSKALDLASKSSISFSDALKQAFTKFPIWMIASTAFFQTINALKFGISTIIEIDKEMTNLQKVTNGTAQEYQNFEKTANSLGSTLGKTTQEVVRSSAEFARLGFNLQQSGILAKEALLLSNVGDFPIEEATTSLISTIKGFDIAVDSHGLNIRKVVDMTNEVANNFAISQDGISEALKRSASSLSSAGNTIEQSVAMITASNSVIQNPEKVGNGLKTVAMRKYLRPYIAICIE